jgi:hypothetical protein
MAVTKEQMQSIMKLNKKLKEYRSIHESTWNDIITYLAASYSSATIGKPGTESAPNYRDLYDTTGIEASNIAADGLQGYAFGRSIAWFRLQFENKMLMEVHANKKWLEKQERKIYAQLDKSNYYDESRAFVKCGFDFGTSVMTLDEDKKRNIPIFHTLHPGTYVIDENQHGEVDTLIRDFYLSKEEAIDKFGEENIPDKMRKSQNIGELYMFSHYIGPNNKIKLDVPGEDEYISLYWADIDKDKPVEAKRFEKKRFFAWRWAKNPCGSPWGVDSPGMVQISNIKMLQSICSDQVRLSQLQGRPPIKKTAGLQINFYPSGMTDLKPGEDFQPQNVTGNLSWTEQRIQMLQQQVRSSYYVDFFLALMTSQDKNKTATEVQALQDEKSAIMASFFSRLAHEFIEPVLEAIYELEMESRRLDKPPAGMDKQNINIDFISPLTMLQKRAQGLNTTKQFLSEILGISEIYLPILDKVDFDEYAELAGEAYSVDNRVIREDDKVRDIRAQRAQMQADQLKRQQAIEAAKVQNDAIAKGSKAPEKGSPVEQSMNQQQGQRRR